MCFLGLIYEKQKKNGNAEKQNSREPWEKAEKRRGTEGRKSRKEGTAESAEAEKQRRRKEQKSGEAKKQKSKQKQTSRRKAGRQRS